MIITQTPLRITLGGGGTDLPSYYEREGGFVVSAAINQYIYINLTRSVYRNLDLYYGKSERVTSIDTIQHSLIRESLRLLSIAPTHLNITSTSDLPGRTGLGSSGSFTVGLLNALHAFKGEDVSQTTLAEEACNIEIDKLNAPVGKQDQYIAAVGGLKTFTFSQEGVCKVESLNLSPATQCELENNLLLFFVGITRDSTSILNDQNDKSKQNDKAMMENLNQIKKIGLDSKLALEAGALNDFIELMNLHWQIKKKRSSNMSNTQIDDLHQFALSNGAAAGKIVGAGGGGFLLLYANDKQKLRLHMQETKAVEVPFLFNHEGSKRSNV